MSSFDQHMMAGALRMAKRGLGSTAPNPSVGTVIADEATGEVVARGWTQPGGRPHAETEALRRAGDRARGKTMYVTLEPCAHHGKTPPCADALIAAGLNRVVLGIGDPDPRTAGQGVARLRAAGIEVTDGVCEDEAHWITLGHILRVTKGRPFVQLKLALGPDGKIAAGADGMPVWVTSPEARAAGHLLRAEADAIVVGAGTVRSDNPALTCRLPGLSHRSPRPVVLAGHAPLRADCALLLPSRKSPATVYEGKDPVASILATLASDGVTRVLIEGGPAIWRVFADAGLVDEAVLFRANDGRMARPAEARAALERHLGDLPLELNEQRQVGPDTMWRFRRTRARKRTTP